MASKQSQAGKDHWAYVYGEWIAGGSGDEDEDEAWGNLTMEPRGVDYTEVEVGGRTAMWAAPKGCADDRVLLCMHGGGFVSGSIYTHRKLFGHLAKAVGARALITSYRFAPEHLHPAPVGDTTTSYRWVLDEGIDPARIALAGDSAGGALAITAQLLARQEGMPLPAAAMLISPWVDMALESDSFETNADKDPFFKRDVVQSLADNFLGGQNSRTDPLASPLYADLEGLPPIYIQVGADETLVGESREFERRAREAGVDVRLDVFDEMLHTFQMMAGRAPEADDAIDRLAAWARPRLGLAEAAGVDPAA